MQRRVLLQAAAGAATALWLASRPAAHAADADAGPWSAWTAEALRAHADARVRALAHAILAPNPQNLQPWRVEFADAARILVRCAPDRRLSVSDLPDRQLTVGFGAFVELYVLALQAEGHAVRVEAFPEGEAWPLLDGRPLTLLHLSPATPVRDPLLDAVLQRHTNRTPFDRAGTPGPERLRELVAVARRPERVFWNLEPERAARIRDITLRAWDAEMLEFAPTRDEVARYTRIGDAAIAAAPWGPAMPDAVLAKAPGPVSEASLSDPASAVFQANRRNYRAAVESGDAHLWIASAQYDRIGMFDAGRDWVRLHLQATRMGLAMQPHSQALHDFAAILPYVRELHAALGVPEPARVQMLGRVGVAAQVNPSPREPAQSHLERA
ncbi:hypothetical protein [Azotobacter vinelandii]|uniref:hypothetical protein n=1 Tax=Azotobacter vinelandii TaxID=354 RepID=UPI0007735A82|nr:hypothetical protein [Azotobacter vinelandii]